MAYTHEHLWWKEAIIYQIYPISFFDSNGDGIGDLNGIHAKLDYLKDLGVDVIWLSPIYKSPLADMGYDISDYCNIDSRYGTLGDWDNLLVGVHQRGMKLVMDLVVNHTSDEHEWFLQSRSSESNPKRDWYIWRPQKVSPSGENIPPNNWRSVFQGSAWDYDEKTKEYYLHLYLSKQPDLNWDNPEVRDVVYRMMRFWLDRGCDGFRMDVINLISKTDGLPDAPVSAEGEVYQPASIYFANGPRVHDYIKEMRVQVLSKYDILTVGETPFTHSALELAKYVLPSSKELNMVFHFELMDVDSPLIGLERVALAKKEWTLEEFREIITRWQLYKRDEGFWNAVFIENHDHARAISRFADDSDRWRILSAKMLAVLEVSQGGTMYIFQGQELGMRNFPRSWGIEEYKDVASINYWNRILKRRREQQGKDDVDMSDILDGFAAKARDHARVPMPWDKSANAGFTTGTPWMRVNDDYEQCNASSQVGDPSSVFEFYKRVVKMRKENPIFTYGEFKDLSNGHSQVFIIEKTLNELKSIVMLNFKKEEVEVEIDGMVNGGLEGYNLLLGNYDEVSLAGHDIRKGKLTLRSFEARIYLK